MPTLTAEPAIATSFVGNWNDAARLRTLIAIVDKFGCIAIGGGADRSVGSYALQRDLPESLSQSEKDLVLLALGRANADTTMHPVAAAALDPDAVNVLILTIAASIPQLTKVGDCVAAIAKGVVSSQARWWGLECELNSAGAAALKELVRVDLESGIALLGLAFSSSPSASALHIVRSVLIALAGILTSRIDKIDPAKGAILSLYFWIVPFVRELETAP